MTKLNERKIDGVMKELDKGELGVNRIVKTPGIKRVSDLRAARGREVSEELFGKEITAAITEQLGES